MAIGKTSTTRLQTNTSDEFSFWLAAGEKVNPTDIVVTQNRDNSQTYGLVTRIESLSDSESHLDNFVSHDFGCPQAKPKTQRLSTNVARCVVLRNTADVYMPVEGGQDVEFADEQGILLALGVGEVQKTDPYFRPLPAGVIELSNGTQAPAIIDVRYLVGPEGAHMNISGISGLAAKTSYAMFLLNALLQSYEEDVAVIIFNVKHDDLLYIDQADAQAQLDEEQKKLWSVIGAKPQPFAKVSYFVPRGSTGSPNTHANTSQMSNFKKYSYSLGDMKGKISYLFADIEDPRDTLRPLIEDIEQDIVSGSIRAKNFSQLIDHFKQYITSTQSGGSGQRSQKRGSYRGHYPATIGKFVRLFRYLVQTGSTGLFVDQKATDEVTLAHHIWTIRAGQVYVVDIAKLRDFERAFVIGDVVNEVYRLFSGEVTYRDVPFSMRREAWQNQNYNDEDPIQPPSKIVFFVDELNKYAPAGKTESPILRNLLEITERGRSLGIVLIGAEQFASDIHPRVVGNCSNRVYGRSDSTELNDPAYRHIPTDLKALITRLDQGKLLLQHPLYRQPVQIRFPRPVYRQPRKTVGTSSAGNAAQTVNTGDGNQNGDQ